MIELAPHHIAYFEKERRGFECFKPHMSKRTARRLVNMGFYSKSDVANYVKNNGIEFISGEGSRGEVCAYLGMPFETKAAKKEKKAKEYLESIGYTVLKEGEL